jgi:hypothetical protein
MFSRLMAKKGKTGGEPSASKQADGSKQPWAYG